MRVEGVTRAALAACMVLGLGAACGGDEGGGTPAGDTATGGDTGKDGTQTGSDATADAGPDAAPVVPLCTSEDDCAEQPGTICSCNGTCVVPEGNACATNKNCPPGMWCDPCLGRCASRVELCDPCALSGACQDGACFPLASGQTVCGLDCISDVGCPTGFGCVAAEGLAAKQCVPVSGSCVDLGLCGDDGDCPDGQVCNDSLKQCAPGCQDDDSCAGDLVCVAARCVDPCATNADCVAPAECTESGRCKVPGSCEGSDECLEAETYCNKKSGMCEPGCLVDADCKDAAKICEGKACVPKGCEHNFQCAFEQECDKATGQCIPMTKDHCATCVADQENQCGGDPNLCVTFSEKDQETGQDVEKGDFCILPCEPDPIDQCPQGYGCQKVEMQDQQGNTTESFYCIRSCWQKPVGAP